MENITAREISIEKDIQAALRNYVQIAAEKYHSEGLSHDLAELLLGCKTILDLRDFVNKYIEIMIGNCNITKLQHETQSAAELLIKLKNLLNSNPPKSSQAL